MSCRVAIALGSSLGDRHRSLTLAVRKLSTTGMRLVRISRWFRTPPLRGGTAKNWFLNAVALFDAELTPEQVLDRCVKIERAAGRRRGKYWADRPLDLDVLLYGDRIVRTERLVLPHPAIARRPFVLVPLLEVWPDAIDPVTGQPYAASPPPPGPWPAPDGILAPSSRVRYL